MAAQRSRRQSLVLEGESPSRRVRRAEDSGSRRSASASVALGGPGDVRVREVQRSRLLAATVGVVGRFGWDGVSVERITQRAGVSRRTFYDLFENRDQCLLAVLESAVAQLEAEIVAADLHGLSWRERVRAGVWLILCFFDREQTLARVCIVESRRGAPAVLAYRQQILDRLVDIVGEALGEGSAVNDMGALTAQGVIGGVGEVLYSTLSKQQCEPLRDLLGQLMGMIVLPYYGVATARREQARPLPEIEPTTINPVGGSESASDARDPLAVLPMRLTYRTARVLQTLAEHPGQSNRQIAELVDIADQGQISKLLARLARLGLLTNSGVLKGERNQWTLTPAGTQITHSIKHHALSPHTSQ